MPIRSSSRALFPNPYAHSAPWTSWCDARSCKDAHENLPMASSEIKLEAVPSVGDILPEDWDACANPAFVHADQARPLSAAVAACSDVDAKPYYNPFVSHAFF